MPSAPNGAVPPSPPRVQETTLQDLWSTVARNRRTVLGITVAVVALVTAASLLVEPVYESEAVVRIDAEDSSSKLLSALGPLTDVAEMGGLSSLTENEIDTEMGVLRSRRIATEVSDSLGLVVEVLSPERHNALVRVVGASRDTINGTFILRRADGGDYRLSASWLTFRKPPLPARVGIGEPFQIGRTTLIVDPSAAAPAPDEIRFRVSSYQQMLRDLDRKLKVNTQASGSKLVEIKYRNSDPALAAAVVNGIVETYLAFREGTDRTDSRRMIETLREETAGYERQLRDAESRLRAFQETNLVIAPEDQATAQIERAAEIQVARDVMEVERDALAVLLEDIRTHAADPDGAPPYRRLAAFPTFVANGGVQDLVRMLNDLENQRTALLARRTEENIDVRTLDTRIAELDLQLYRLGTNYLAGLQNQIASSNAALARFNREMEQVPSLEIEYTRLMRDRELLGEIYVTMQARLEEAQVQDAIDEREVRVIDYGMVPEKPVFPKPLVNALLASVLGLMIGLSMVMGREMVTTRIRTRHDAESAASGVPVLAIIPPAPTPTAQAGGNGRQRRLVRMPWMAANGAGHRPDRSLITRTDEWHAASEAYRSLLAAMGSEGAGDALAVIALTSPDVGEAASRVAANLAVTLAQQGGRTLVIDVCSAGTLQQHHLFDVPAQPGLTEALAGEASIDDLVHPIDLGAGAAPLHVLSAGRRAGAGRRVRSAELRALVADARTRYDHVVIDTPQLSIAADATVIGRLADATVLVARNGITTQEALEDAATRLRRAGVHLAGIVLDDAPAGFRVALPTRPGSA